MSNAQFSKDEQEIMAELDKLASEDDATDLQATADDDGQSEQPDEDAQQIPQADTLAAKEPTDADKAAETPAEQPKDQQPEPKGDVRAALRAARRGERQARAEAERLKAEIEALKAGKAPAKDDPDDLSDEDLAELEDYAPKQAAKVRALREQAKAARASTQPVEPEKPAFVAPVLPDELQDAVDQLPDLMAWQYDETSRALWEAAVAQDLALSKLPQWQNRPAAERLAEVERLVKLAAGLEKQATPTTAADKARQRIANAPRERPPGIGDLRGGAPAARERPNYDGMSDEEIMNSL